MHSTRAAKLSDRDLAALEFIGRSYEVAQYQLHATVFAGRAPTVVSRFVSRAVRAGLLNARRTLGIGANRLRLTHDGFTVLDEKLQPCEAERLFVPRRPVASKDVEHTTFINDICVALESTEPPPRHVYPAWYLQRQLGADAVAIPDVLALWPNTSDHNSLVLACEVDLGAEPLNRVFIPKLRRLAEIAYSSSQPSDAAILVFTRGKRRRSMLEEGSSDIGSVHADLLPDTTGLPSICYLREVIGREATPFLYAAGYSNRQTLDAVAVASD